MEVDNWKRLSLLRKRENFLRAGSDGDERVVTSYSYWCVLVLTF